MRWRTVAVTVGAALLCGLGTSCAPPTPSEEESSMPAADLSDVDVDTPALQKIKNKAGIANCPRTKSAEPVDGGLPDVTLPCLGGGPDVNLASLRGEPLVINLWASWCGPCREELPLIQRLHETGDVQVVGVDIEDPQPDTALELARDTGVTYPLLADPAGETTQPLQVAGAPHTVFVSADGEIQGTKRGEFTSYSELAKAVREHLGVNV